MGAALRTAFALRDDGIFWPDEIYQSLEPAHRAAFGYGLVAWEYVQGARHWAFAGLIALVYKLTSLLGLDSPRQYLAVVRIAFCAVGIGTALAIRRLALATGAGKLAAACGSALFSLMGMAIYFAPRAMSETACALPAAAGLALCLRRNARVWEIRLGASLLGFSVLLRLQCALFCLGLVAVLWIRRNRRAAIEAVAVLVCWGVLFGLVDKLTWGTWFHSASSYLRFNLLQRGAERFGTAPPAYYTAALLSSLGPLWVIMTGLALAAIPSAPGLWLIALVFFVPHWLSPHKELRFLMPLLPVLCALAAVGLQRLLEVRSRWVSGIAPAAALAVALYSAATFKQLTFGRLGVYEPAPGTRSALDAGGRENRLLLAAHEAPDLCGLQLLTNDLDFIGGFSYLHRRVPLYGPSGPPMGSHQFNYVIAARGAVAGREVASDSNLVLLRLFEGSCAPDPGYHWRLPE